jgi:DNA repair protein RadA/Sms
MIVVDSVQTLTTSLLESPAGSVSQVRECSAMLLRYAKTTGTPVIIIGHITKDGTLAGPKVLEHIVDVVLLFEGDNNYIYRLLRPSKNRFGSTSELGIFEMLETGLREVTNPSELFINRHDDMLSGVTIAATIDGIRPFMIETQALVSTAVYGTPQRSSTGYDGRRLNMLLAVLEKRAGFRLGTRDVFLNIAGGIKVNDPAIDLAVLTSVLSSNLDIAVPPTVCFAGEIGLSGEIRPVPRIEQRIREAAKLGFEKMVISKYHKDSNLPKNGPELIRAGKIETLVKAIFA